MRTNLPKIPALFTFTKEILKGYLCYKTILHHIVALDVKLMNFFIWRKNDVRSRDIQGFAFL